MPKFNFQTAADAFCVWRDTVLQGQPPIHYPVGTGDLARIEIGPGLVTLIGGAPGSGKTAFVMQMTTDALRLTPSLRVCVCNIEMPPAVLLDRQLARLSGIPLTEIRYRRLGTAHAGRLNLAMTALEEVADRLCFVRPPFNLENLGASADEFGANVLVLDYIQRIAPPGKHGDKRGSVDACMDYLRQFADASMAVIAVSAVGRTKDSRNRSSYDSAGLNLASYRESSELEFGADDAFILAPDKRDAGFVTLKHLKARNSDPKDIPLRFNRSLQRFGPVTLRSEELEAGRQTAALAELWNRTEPADDDSHDGVGRRSVDDDQHEGDSDQDDDNQGDEYE